MRSTPARLRAITLAHAALVAGYGFARALADAKTSDAFLVAPRLSQLAHYALAFLCLAGLALAVDYAGPAAAMVIRQRVRDGRALVRRRVRHGRSRAEIGNAEVALTLSSGCLALVAALLLVPLKGLILALVVLAMAVVLFAVASWTRLVGYDPRWSALVGFTGGLLFGFRA